MRQFISRCFRSMDLSLIIKAYVVGLVFTGFSFWIHPPRELFWAVLYIVNLVVYPFAYLLVECVLPLPPIWHIFDVGWGESMIGGIALYLLRLILLYFVFTFAVFAALVCIGLMAVSTKFRGLSERWRNGA